MMGTDQIETIDKSNMVKLLREFPRQFNQAMEIGNNANISLAAEKIKNILFVGMGGSAIGGDVIISCVGDQLRVPAQVNRNYVLPNFVNENTLVVVFSFSGNTEESLSCFSEALNRKAQIVCVTSGGKLKQHAGENKIPVITIPGGMPPRCALGYLSVPALLLLSRNELVSVEKEDFQETLALLKELAEKYSPQSAENLAMRTAEQLAGKIPVIYSSNDMLNSVALRWKCQFSENAKQLAFANVFPELNHNEIVGWDQLPELLRKFQIIYLKDAQDNPRNAARMSITKEILEQVTNSVLSFQTLGKSRLARLFSLIYLGDMTSFYLAIRNKVDPTPIEKIQILKDKLSQIKN
ncbi:MAG: bifunctional phosphoglucose/phosphomannose isomerase [Calditrichaeota bacterium]|nr:bifunctional phosphoglucose/phosphomannose isomerase [Calditrichota bacterium]